MSVLLLGLGLLAPRGWAQATARLEVSSRVFDPKLAGAELACETERAGTGSYRAELSVLDGQGQTVRELVDATRSRGRSYRDRWDGRDASGRFVAPGDYTLRFQGAGSSRTLTLHVVRLGVRAIEFEGSGRVPLTYHRAEAWSGSAFPVDNAGPAWTLPRSRVSAGCLDLPDGTPLDLPAYWTDVNGPPRTSSGALVERGRSLPVAYRVGTTPQVRVTLGQTAAVGGRERSANYPIAGRPLRIVVEGGPGADTMSGELRPGDRVTLDLQPLGPWLGKWLLRVPLRFAYREDDGSWRLIPGGQLSEHLLYTVLERPSGQDVPGGRPWVAALDLVSTWLRDDTQREAEALARIVRGINGGLGLSYEATQGAPAYTGGPDLASPELDLSAFLADRQNGRRVNCLDCASLVTQLAAQLGARGQIEIMGWDFRLYFLRGLGAPGFARDLFYGMHAFSYHAVATFDRGVTIHDACLSVDDDASPWVAPFRERLPIAMPEADYRRQLSYDWFGAQLFGRASPR
ncbi:MAG: hypothetical protein R3F62_23425 [Planctomycetota bacterium]